MEDPHDRKKPRLESDSLDPHNRKTTSASFVGLGPFGALSLGQVSNKLVRKYLEQEESYQSLSNNEKRQVTDRIIARLLDTLGYGSQSNDPQHPVGLRKACSEKIDQLAKRLEYDNREDNGCPFAFFTDGVSNPAKRRCQQSKRIAPGTE